MSQEPNGFGSEIHRYLDGELHADGLDASARSEADRLIEAVASYRDGLEVVGSEVDRAVMAAIRARASTKRASLWGWLFQPRVFQMRPALAAAMVVVLVIAGVVGGSLRGRAPATTVGHAAPATVLVRFELIAPNAHRVSLTGSFNSWQADGIQLTRSPETGVWAGTVPLSPGEHQYMFVIDGVDWIPDPEAHAQVDDGFGQTNSVIVVGPRGVIRS